MTAARILIVEDELVVGLDLQYRLAEMGYEVLAVVPTGQEAIDQVSVSPPSLVLMDIKLAGEMDGIQAAGRIREHIDVPIIFVTAFADETTTKRVKAVAPYGYVVKPFQREALRAVIETALVRHGMERRLQESEQSVRRANESERALRKRLEGIDRAGIAVGRALTALGGDMRPCLQVVVDEARALVGAEYAALGMLTESGGSFDPWVHSGVDPETMRAIGSIPRGVGLLGDEVCADRPLRLRDLRGHPATAGLPLRHPEMTSFLGVPIHYRGERRGSFYLANKQGGEEFTDEDEASITMLADRVGAALEIARLRQIEARERARLGFLANAGTKLAASLDVDVTLAAIADLIVPSLADMCAIDLDDESGARRRAFARHIDSSKEGLLGALPVAMNGGSLEGVTHHADSSEELRALGLRSNIAVPLSLRGRSVGALQVATVASGRRLTPGDLSLVREIARLATLAVENARYHQATRRSESEQRFLADLGATLASSLHYLETLRMVCHLAVQGIADGCIVDVLEGDGRMRRLEVSHADPAKQAACEELERLQLAGPPTYIAAPVVKTRRPLLLAEVDAAYLRSVAQNEEHLRLLQELDPRSLMVLPLLVRGRLLGCLFLFSSQASRKYGARDLTFATQVAENIALAVDNAWLYETAQRAIRARDDVLGVVAHDLRSPLNSILMQSELVKRLSNGEGGTRRSAEAIRGAAKRMNRLIEDLLDVGRLDAGQLALEIKRLSAEAIAAEAAESQRGAAAERTQVLELRLADGLPDISGDRERLLQVFDNLIGNAIKFTPAGGRITLGAREQDGDVVFSIADTGPGIPSADLEHVFDRFWQARKSDRRGSGLGLPIVKGIVQAHGGRIWAESAPGNGSTFHFTIGALSRRSVG